jgi:hypothetical protein
LDTLTSPEKELISSCIAQAKNEGEIEALWSRNRLLEKAFLDASPAVRRQLIAECFVHKWTKAEWMQQSHVFTLREKYLRAIPDAKEQIEQGEFDDCWEVDQAVKTWKTKKRVLKGNNKNAPWKRKLTKEEKQQQQEDLEEEKFEVVIHPQAGHNYYASKSEIISSLVESNIVPSIPKGL